VLEQVVGKHTCALKVVTTCTSLCIFCVLLRSVMLGSGSEDLVLFMYFFSANNILSKVCKLSVSYSYMTLYSSFKISLQ